MKFIFHDKFHPSFFWDSSSSESSLTSIFQSSFSSCLCKSSSSSSSSQVSSYSQPSSSWFDHHVNKFISRFISNSYFSLTLLLLLLTCYFPVTQGLRIRRLTSIPEICANVNGLTSEQLIACREQSQAVLAVSEGTRKGITECQQQFKYERWNCTPDANDNMYNKILQRGSQETAFFYAITSSGVVHTLSQTCASGNITDCACSRRIEASDSPGGWKWGGCSDNIDYAMNFAKKFVDSPEEEVLKRKPNDPEAIMNLHNNQAGRLAVYRKMNKQCRCHGISGSCEVKTCWRVLPRFSEIGNDLKEKYEKSIKIKRNIKRRKGRKVDQIIGENDLIYIRKSPDYCKTNVTLGILGTSGRVCNKNSTGPDSCDLLCCGRGYNIQRVTKQELCNCRFRWCCEVICEQCKPKEEYIYTCK